ncbi:MAG: FliM/FliN family flagellar motor switch protein [Paracoccaceae bacterium]
MGEATSNTFLKRKAAAGREDHLARAMTIQKAVRITAAKAAEDLLQLPLATLAIATDTFEISDLDERIKEDCLLLLLDGQHGQPALAMLDSSLVGGLVQQQTLGRVLEAGNEVRRMTQTDAALTAPFVDELLTRVPKILEMPGDIRLLSGYQFGVMADELRAVKMALEAQEFTCLKITMDLFKGARQGELTLIFPHIEDNELASQNVESEADDDATPPPDLAQSLMKLNAELHITLGTIRVPISQLQQLAPGQALRLPPDTFPNVQISGSNGRFLGEGKLGQVEGQRAVRPVLSTAFDSQPMRRDADRDNLDLPEVSGIPGEAGAGLPALHESPPLGGFDMPSGDGGLDLPDLEPTGDGFPDLPVMPEVLDVAEEIAPVNDIPPMDDLPELDDFPDLADLPELNDLPDLGDLPDLKTA